MEGGDAVPGQPRRNVVPAIKQHWNFERLLGTGSQSDVWAATSNKTDQRVAVRLLQNCDDTMRELEVYRQLRSAPLHPHVLNVQFGLVDK